MPKLPGIAPCAAGDWLRVDEAYAAQMGVRLRLLSERRDDVLWMPQDALKPAQEVLEEALTLLPNMGFEVSAESVLCPDGRVVDIDWSAPLALLGTLIQEDICLMEKRGEAHVLTGAVLCFPASWRLSEKAGKPLIAIHEPVEEYDEALAPRVQRLFDGVKAGRPLWRFNQLWYDDPTLYQPRPGSARRIAPSAKAAPYLRAERQCLVRMPRTQAVVFSIHSYVVKTAL